MSNLATVLPFPRTPAGTDQIPTDPEPGVPLTLDNLHRLRTFADPKVHVLQAFHWKVLIARWLRDKPTTTADLYLFEIQRFLAFVAWKPIAAVTIHDLEAYMDSITELAPRTRGRRLSTVKSLLSWVHKVETDHLPRNVGAAVKLPKSPDGLASRILEEDQVLKVIHLADNPRDAAMLRVLYSAGIRVAELVGLNWGDIVEHNGEVQITVTGKGSKTRSILISRSAYTALLAIRPAEWSHDTPVFVSRLKQRMSTESATNAVSRAARLAGMERKVTAHWMRHACATHTLDNGGLLPAVSAKLGHSSLAVTGRYTHARAADPLYRFLKA